MKHRVFAANCGREFRIRQVQERQAALRYVPLWAAHVEPKARIGKDDLRARYCLIST